MLLLPGDRDAVNKAPHCKADLTPAAFFAVAAGIFALDRQKPLNRGHARGPALCSVINRNVEWQQ